MESKKVLEVVLGGAVTGFSIALGWMAANKLVGAIGGKKTVVTGTSELIGGFGGKKVAGRKSCDMGNGEYILVASGTPCTSVGGSEVR
jgi:hypothetical protein